MVVGVEGVSVVLEGFSPADPELAEAAGWVDLIDSWGVDWDHDGETFDLCWVSCDSRKDPGVVLTTPVHSYAETGTYRVAVKVVDVLGDEVIETVEVTAGYTRTPTDDLEE